jgi:hypothetical protein
MPTPRARTPGKQWARRLASPRVPFSLVFTCHRIGLSDYVRSDHFREKVFGMMPPRQIPLALKIVYSGFMVVLVPVYTYHYGLPNFLYFCDVALFLTLIGVWREDALLVSMPAVGILAPQIIWLADYAAHFAGFSLTGVTGYMFDADKSLFLRSLSLFHGWQPILLLYLVSRTGYDPRALVAWTVLAWVVLAICYLFMPPPMPNPGNAAVNINYVHGMSDTAAQTWMPPLAWLACLAVGLPLLLYVPTHLALKTYFAPAARPALQLQPS